MHKYPPIFYILRKYRRRNFPGQPDGHPSKAVWLSTLGRSTSDFIRPLIYFFPFSAPEIVGSERIRKGQILVNPLPDGIIWQSKRKTRSLVLAASVILDGDQPAKYMVLPRINPWALTSSFFFLKKIPVTFWSPTRGRFLLRLMWNKIITCNEILRSRYTRWNNFFYEIYDGRL